MSLGKLIMGIGSVIAGMKTLADMGQETAVSKKLDEAPDKRAMKTKTYTVNTIEQRVKHIVTMIQKGRDHAQVRQLTVQCLSRKCGPDWCVPEKNWWAEVQAIFNFFRKNVRYTRDTYNKDLFQHPARTLQFGGGDCDDAAITLGAMLQSVGYPVRLRVIRTKDSPEWNHIYLLVGMPPKDPKRWISLDGSVNQPAGWEAPKAMIAEKRDFNVA